jgi:hypothetical protein
MTIPVKYETKRDESGVWIRGGGRCNFFFGTFSRANLDPPFSFHFHLLRRSGFR